MILYWINSDAEVNLRLRAAGDDLSSVMVSSKFTARLIHLGLTRRFGMLKK